MTTGPSSPQFIAAMAKHLPPSASALRLVDIGGRCESVLAARRDDLEIEAVLPSALAQLTSSSVDAVSVFDTFLSDNLLSCAMDALRPGGRFIAVLSAESVDETWMRLLENHGYVRILVEAAVDGVGVLLRGERAHPAADTRQRISSVAAADADLLNLSSYRGRYLHLLIRQSPNKPVWQLRADERIEWRALALQLPDSRRLLAFSSLPKAVGFLQEAVLAGATYDINKVGKFDKATAATWQWEIELNPKADLLQIGAVFWRSVDPESAAASDE